MRKCVLTACWFLAVAVHGQTVARVGDKTIEQPAVDAAIEKTLFDQRVQVYHARRRAALNLIDHDVLALEAKARHVAAEDVLADLDAEQRGEALRALRRKYHAKVLLEAPRMLVLAPPAELPSRGAAAAKVEIVEFADYQCPYCAREHETLVRLLDRYPDAKLTFRDFPLAGHANARDAARAARCMAAQGKYWAFHDLLFKQEDLSLAHLFDLAAGMGDAAAFHACMSDDATDRSIESDRRLGDRMGVTGTPAVFVNGIPMTGTPTFNTLAEMIEQELDRPNP